MNINTSANSLLHEPREVRRVSLAAIERPLAMAGLMALMRRTRGSPAISIGLIDGPVVAQHADLRGARCVALRANAVRAAGKGPASIHGTYVAGILMARRGSQAPAICPDCTLVVRPIFDDDDGSPDLLASSPQALADALCECIAAGVRLINISAAMSRPFVREEAVLREALDLAARRGVLVFAAAGNDLSIAASAITAHPWVVPVAAWSLAGQPSRTSNLGASVGQRGIGAPGEAVTSLGADGEPLTRGGTSAATAFVTGTAALLWSEYPRATAQEIRAALVSIGRNRRRTIVPPLLNAAQADRHLSAVFTSMH